MREFNRAGRVVALVALVLSGSSLAQGINISNISISGGTSTGSIAGLQSYEHDFTRGYSGVHTGIICNTNTDCVVTVDAAVAPNSSFSFAESDVFLSSWTFLNNNGIDAGTLVGDEIGRVRVRLTLNSYTPSTGALTFEASLRMDTTNSTQFFAQYAFSILVGSTSGKILLTKGLSRTCNGPGDSCATTPTNVVNVRAPDAGVPDMVGFLAQGFDVRTASGDKGVLGRIAVDSSKNAPGTTSGGVLGDRNWKLGLECAFEVVSAASSPDLEDITCTSYTAGFAVGTGHSAYKSTFANLPNPSGYFSYVASAPSNVYSSTTPYYAPVVSTEVYRGLIPALSKFDLAYTGAIPLTSMLSAGFALTSFDPNVSPEEAQVAGFGVLRVDGAGNPANDFAGQVEAFLLWPQLGP